MKLVNSKIYKGKQEISGKILSFWPQAIGLYSYNKQVRMFALGKQNHLMPNKTISHVGNELGSITAKFHSQQRNISAQAKESGFWTLREQMKYITFLKEHYQLFKTQESRKKNRVFRLMSKSIGTRRTSQCKSHHQKMILAHRKVSSVIKNLKSEMGNLQNEWDWFMATEPRVFLRHAEERRGEGQQDIKITIYNDSILIRLEISEWKIDSY